MSITGCRVWVTLRDVKALDDASTALAEVATVITNEGPIYEAAVIGLVRRANEVLVTMHARSERALEKMRSSSPAAAADQLELKPAKPIRKRRSRKPAAAVPGANRDG